MSPSMFNSSNNKSGLAIKTSQFKPTKTQITSNNNDDEMNEDEYDYEESNNNNNNNNKQFNKRFSNNNNNEELTAYPLDLTVKSNSNAQQQILSKKIKLENNLDFYSHLKPTNTNNNNNNSDSENLLNRKHLTTSTLNLLKQQQSSPLKNIQSIAESYLINNNNNSQIINDNKHSPNSSCSFQRPSSTPSPSLSINSNNTPMSNSNHNCNNHGYCNDGQCYCDEGFTGEICQYRKNKIK